MKETFTESEQAQLAPYMTNLDSSIFALRNLPEEVVAVLFAYYSRSRDSLRRNLLKLLQEGDLELAGGSMINEQLVDEDHLTTARAKARQFHEKWVVGYGHSSVAEHGCVHLALEDVSIIATKLIEDARLASYTEKSTRYVAFDANRMYYPPEIMANPELGSLYKETITSLLDAYTGWTEDIVAKIKERVPRSEKQTERAYDTASRATAFDILRYLLPAATYTNLGLTLNARSLENLITKLMSQPIPEGRQIGARIKEEAQHIVPTLLKYADENPYRMQTDIAMSVLSKELGLANHNQQDIIQDSSVKLMHMDEDAEDQLVASILYGYSGLCIDDLVLKVKEMSPEEKMRVVDQYLEQRGKHDAPGRALERVSCTIEITMDFGAYRDVQRHRIATQTIQRFNPYLGFAMPPEIEMFGYKDQYIQLLEQASATYKALYEAGYEDIAHYILPLATRIRTLFTWNLREVTHFVELRSARQGHPSYRRVAQEVYRVVNEAFPLIGKYIRPNMKVYSLTRDG